MSPLLHESLFKRKRHFLPCEDFNVWVWKMSKLQRNELVRLMPQFSCCEWKKKWRVYQNARQCAQLRRPVEAHTQEVMTVWSCQKTHLLTCSSENDNNLGLLSVQDVPRNYYLSTESSWMTNCWSMKNNKNGFNSNLSRLWYAQQMIAKHDTDESKAISIKRLIVWIGYQSYWERWMDIFAFIPCRSHRILSGLGLKIIFVAKANGKQLEFNKYCWAKFLHFTGKRKRHAKVFGAFF